MQVFFLQCYSVDQNLGFSAITVILVALAQTLSSHGRKKCTVGPDSVAVLQK